VSSKKGVDEIDIKIMKCLLRNARTSFAEIAEECKVSTATIKNRYNQLKKAGIIKGSTVVLDLAYFGIEGDAYLQINVNYRQINQFIRDTKNKTGISCTPSRLTKNYNVICWAPTSSIGEIEKIKEKIKHPSLIEKSTSIWTYMKVIPDNLSLTPQE
jgi:DNA-binding Lrp family transcriptional regulator